MQIIKSEDNKVAKELAALATRKGRRESGSFSVEGFRGVRDAVNAGAWIRRIVVLDAIEEQPDVKEILIRMSSTTEMYLAAPSVMRKISTMDTPQGIFAEVVKPPAVTIEKAPVKGACVLACDIQDPRNMGMLIRTVEAAGAGCLYIASGSTDPFHPTAVQTSMGSIFYRRFVAGIAPMTVIETAKAAGVQVVATVPSGGISAGDWAGSAAGDFLLLVGNEGAGLRGEVQDAADVAVTLPIHGKAESLNVAVSAGILLYLKMLVK